MLLVEASRAAELGLTPIAFVGPSATAGVDPACMGLGPIPATRKVLERSGLTVDDLDVIELLQAATAEELAAARGGDLATSAMLHKRLTRLERGPTGLRHFKVGRQNRYGLSEVLAFVERQTELER